MATFLKPAYAGGRIPLATGEVIVGAIFPPTGPRAAWRWTLFQTGEAQKTEGGAKEEATAREQILEAWHTRCAAMGLTPRREAYLRAARICRMQAETIPALIHEGALACERALTAEAEK